MAPAVAIQGEQYSTIREMTLRPIGTRSLGILALSPTVASVTKTRSRTTKHASLGLLRFIWRKTLVEIRHAVNSHEDLHMC